MEGSPSQMWLLNILEVKRGEMNHALVKLVSSAPFINQEMGVGRCRPNPCPDGREAEGLSATLMATTHSSTELCPLHLTLHRTLCYHVWEHWVETTSGSCEHLTHSMD